MPLSRVLRVFIYEGNRMPTAAELTTHPNGKYRQLTRMTATSNIEGSSRRW